MTGSSAPPTNNRRKRWRQLGWATLLFFIIKGTISTILLLWAGQSILSGC